MSGFEDKVRQTVEQLRRRDFGAMRSEIADRRLKWLEGFLAREPAQAAVTPRRVFELLFFEQMGLDPRELQVLADTPDRIVWESYNRCPLLEACVALGLDTRHVCRPVNEQATQAFCSRLDPRLRFYRSYAQIRPHAPSCREWIARVDFDASLRAASAISAAGSGPAGGAIVRMDDRVVATSPTPCLAEAEPARHGAWRALVVANGELGGSGLCGGILFLAGEPCADCVALAVRLHLTSIVFLPSEGGRRSALASALRPATLAEGPIEIIAVPRDPAACGRGPSIQDG